MDNNQKIVETTLQFISNYPRAEEWINAISRNERERAHYWAKFNHQYERCEHTSMAILEVFSELDTEHVELFTKYILGRVK